MMVSSVDEGDGSVSEPAVFPRDTEAMSRAFKAAAGLAVFGLITAVFPWLMRLNLALVVVLSGVLLVLGVAFGFLAISAYRFVQERRPLIELRSDGLQTCRLPGSLPSMDRADIKDVVVGWIADGYALSFRAAPHRHLERLAGPVSRLLIRRNQRRGLGVVTVVDLQCAVPIDDVVAAVEQLWPDCRVIHLEQGDDG